MMRTHNFKKQLQVALVLVIIAVYGSMCTGSGNKETKTESKELLAIRSFEIYPSQVVGYGEDITLRLEIENIGQESTALILDLASEGGISGSSYKGNGSLVLYDICKPLFQIKNFEISTTNQKFETRDVDLNYDGEKETVNVAVLDPHDYAILTWQIRTPRAKDALYLTAECDFKVRVGYLSTAETFAQIYFASQDELAQRLYTQKDMPGAGNNVATYGPVLVKVRAEHQPYPAGEGITYTLPVVIENLGDGVVEVKSLEIELPNGFTPVKEYCEYFDSSGSGKLTLNTRDEDVLALIKLYGRKSSQLVCELSTPNVNYLKAFLFHLKADYEYYILDSKRIKVTEKY